MDFILQLVSAIENDPVLGFLIFTGINCIALYFLAMCIELRDSNKEDKK